MVFNRDYFDVERSNSCDALLQQLLSAKKYKLCIIMGGVGHSHAFLESMINILSDVEHSSCKRGLSDRELQCTQSRKGKV